MKNKVNINDVYKILKGAFPNTQISKDCLNLKINDFKEWDSLGNFNLLLAFEEFYQIRFSIDEMNELNSVSKIIDIIDKNYD